MSLFTSLVFVYFHKIGKLGVPVKTNVSATVLEEALNGKVLIHPLPLGQPLLRRVEKQCAHFYSVNLIEEDLSGGIVCRVHSSDKSKFKICFGISDNMLSKRLLSMKDGFFIFVKVAYVDVVVVDMLLHFRCQMCLQQVKHDYAFVRNKPRDSSICG